MEVVPFQHSHFGRSNHEFSNFNTILNAIMVLLVYGTHRICIQDIFSLLLKKETYTQSSKIEDDNLRQFDQV